MLVTIFTYTMQCIYSFNCACAIVYTTPYQKLQCSLNEGWLYQGFETYCSDRYLMAEHPDENLANLREHVSDNDSDTYWTAWE